MNEKIKIAIVGLGFGVEFIPIYQKHPNAEMAGWPEHWEGLPPCTILPIVLARSCPSTAAGNQIGHNLPF